MRQPPYDVLVAGGGNAALCAALEAARGGARVLVCEKAERDFRGGNSRHTRDIRYRHEAADEHTNGAYTTEEFSADLERVAGGSPFDRSLAALLVERSAALPAWMSAQGVRWQASLRGALSLHTANAFFLGGGRALMNTYYRRAQALGVEVAYESEVVDLDLDAGAFRAAIVAGPDGTTREVAAAALVVASGGFEANRDWLRDAIGAAADGVIVRGTRNNDGRLLGLLLERGAEPVGDPTAFHAVAVDARSPAYDGGIVTRVDSIPFGIVVDRQGRRFADEGADLWPKRYASWGGLIAQQPGQVAFSIINASDRGSFIPPAYPALEAATLDDAALAAGIPIGILRATVDAYNAAVCSDGPVDVERLDGNRTEGLEPPKSHWAAPLEPPFHVHPLRPGITFTYRGVRVDERARVVWHRGPSVQNIYAAGEVMAGNVLGRGYLAGLGLTIGHVFGAIAGREAAGGR